MKAYANLIDDERSEIIVIIDNQPYTWNTAYDEINNNELLKIATPEKALIDMFYLSQTKTRLFRSLPEVELPKQFKLSIANKIIGKIPSTRKRTLVKRLFAEFIDKFMCLTRGVDSTVHDFLHDFETLLHLASIS